MSKIGGSWRDDGNEIVSLPIATNENIGQALLSASDVDYAVIFISGHGTHPNNLNPLLTRVDIADGDIRVKDLNPHNGKCLIIVDSCRAVAALPKPTVEFLTENTRVAARELGGQAYRTAFDQAVNSCLPQVTYMFACDIDQSSFGNRTHDGLFTRTLIASAVGWEKEQEFENTFLTVKQAFDLTRLRVRHTPTSTHQTPQFHRYNSIGRHLPFCINL
jgi:hypothetical protein